MKMTKIKLTALLATALTVLCVLTGCSQWELPYEGLDKDGYPVSVRAVLLQTPKTFRLWTFSDLRMRKRMPRATIS